MLNKRWLSKVGAFVIAVGTMVVPNYASAAWVQVWSDEFNGANGSGVDHSKWNADTGAGGWGNNELQYYTNRTQNAYMENGKLVIQAIKENYNGSQYTSARLTTGTTFTTQYGKVEMRAKLPYGQGIWPAFWMLGSNIGSVGVGWPKCGEIDIMENVGKTPKTVYGTVHGPGYSGANGIGGSYSIAQNFSNDFHTYAVEWEPSEIRFYVDNNLYKTVKPGDTKGNPWVYDHPFFIILNLAVGGNWPGNPDASTVFPQKYYVDYVRVYKQSTSSSVIFNNFDTSQGYSAGANATATYNSSGQNIKLTTNLSGDPGNASQCVKIVPQKVAPINASSYSKFTFWINDTQGSNTVKVTMVDTNNAVWSGWTTAAKQNTWGGISLPMSSVTGINKAAIKEIRLGEWNKGTYYLDGLQFNN